MHRMTIDLETYSDQDLGKFGVHKYVDSDFFEVLLLAYAIDDGPVMVCDLTEGTLTAPEDRKSRIPPEVVEMLYSPEYRKCAFNANFELTCLTSRNYFPDLPTRQWECDSVLARYNGFPTGLGVVAEALELAEDKQKDKRGKALIQFFCKPCRATKANGGRTRNRPQDAPEKWQVFKEYNAQDVVTERAIRDKLVRTGYLPTPMETDLYHLDRAINCLGIGIDMDLARNAIRLNSELTERLLNEARNLTGLENPNSPAQLKEWLRLNGHPVESLSKAAIEEMLQQPNLHPALKKVLHIRQQLGKSSVKKYEAMAGSICSDGRAHDLFMFYGARTGRWAGRNIQLQNLPRNYLPDLDEAREAVKQGDLDWLMMLYDNVPDVLSQLIRTALVPAPGHRFIVADFSAIEARVIAWIAGERWRQEAFAKGEDIYCASASQMFHVPVVKHGVNGHLRQRGKIAELALGYGGGIGALKAMGADKMGLSDTELQDIVSKWRKASPRIPELWNRIDETARRAIRNADEDKRYQVARGIYFSWKCGNLILHLPSGRVLVYRDARIGQNRFGGVAIIYKGLDLTHHWDDLETYGGKLTENLIQAVARDCLAVAMLRLWQAGYRIVAHIHDEVVLDTPEGQGSLEDAIRIMTQNTTWNEGLLLNADGFEAPYYKKD